MDGIILTRSLENDKAIEYLLKQNFPVGLTGLYEDERVIQVDTDNESAAENMTSLLISKGFRRFALLVEDLDYHVNRSRYDGFQKALLKNGIGMAGAVICIALCVIPLVQTAGTALLYKLAAAVIQPVSDERVTGCVEAVGEGCQILLHIVFTVGVLFLLTIAIVAAVTNA